MKRWFFLLAILVAALLQSGCGDGVGLSREERLAKYRKGLELDMKMMNDDIDLILLNTRPSRLSRYRVP